MTSRRRPKSQPLLRPALLIVASMTAMSLAGLAARAALAAPAHHSYLSLGRSVDVLRAAFGDFAERSIRETQVVVAPTSAATWALSDEVNIANQAWNPRTGRLWALGDARGMWPAGMGGFTDPVTGGVYINAQTAAESHVPHELLHANASADFLLTVGVAINEGVTQQLALDAMEASGLGVEKAPAYAEERALAAALSAVTGRDRLVRAYFNGGTHLAGLVAAVGADTLAKVKIAAAANNLAGAMNALNAVPVA